MKTLRDLVKVRLHSWKETSDSTLVRMRMSAIFPSDLREIDNRCFVTAHSLLIHDHQSQKQIFYAIVNLDRSSFWQLNSLHDSFEAIYSFFRPSAALRFFFPLQLSVSLSVLDKVAYLRRD